MICLFIYICIEMPAVTVTSQSLADFYVAIPISKECRGRGYLSGILFFICTVPVEVAIFGELCTEYFV